MPTYEYECKACGQRHDAFQRMSDDPLVDCPNCGKPELKKLVSAAAFQLKGNGWYKTDFKDSGKKEPAKSGTDSSKSDSGSKQPEAKHPDSEPSGVKASAAPASTGDSGGQ